MLNSLNKNINCPILRGTINFFELLVVNNLIIIS